MKLLAIDTSTEVASVALLVDTKLYEDACLSQKTQAQKILPMIESLMADKVQLNQLDGIIFGRGPGSFTGLRIACSIAKGLAYAHGIPLYAVSTLASLAYEARKLAGNADKPVLAVLDARMQELYWGYFAKDSFETEERVSVPADIVLTKDKDCLLAGQGFALYPEVFAGFSGISLYPKALAMIQLVQKGVYQSIAAASAEPVYIRNNVTQGSKNG